MFKLWSQIQPNVADKLKPNLGMRTWDDLNKDDKHIIWKNLDWYFFDKNQKTEDDGWGNEKKHYHFYALNNEEKNRKLVRIINSISDLNQKYKVKNYAPNFLENMSLNSACFDFVNIFENQNSDVIFELISFYCEALILERAEDHPYRGEGENDEEYAKRMEEWRFQDFDSFSNKLNEVFDDFGLNVILTRQGFIPKQDKIITEKIFIPTLQALSDKKWKKVNEHLTDAFRNYRNKDFSESITNTISAVQAYLQITVEGNIGKGQISDLLKKAEEKSLIPNDKISKLVFRNIESIFASERQQKGMAHPRIENPNEENARVILNLAMVFIQHCIQGNK